MKLVQIKKLNEAKGDDSLDPEPDPKPNYFNSFKETLAKLCGQNPNETQYEKYIANQRKRYPNTQLSNATLASALLQRNMDMLKKSENQEVFYQLLKFYFLVQWADKFNEKKYSGLSEFVSNANIVRQKLVY